LLCRLVVQMRADLEWRNGRGLVRLAGRLDAAHVTELVQLCREQGQPPTLDLSDLLSADEAGLEMLETLRAGGVLLVGASPYLKLQLDIVRERRAPREKN
jgi:anti-anti-sigma regulatory factor